MKYEDRELIKQQARRMDTSTDDGALASAIMVCVAHYFRSVEASKAAKRKHPDFETYARAYFPPGVDRRTVAFFRERYPTGRFVMPAGSTDWDDIKVRL